MNDTHYTVEECREMLPRWMHILDRDSAALLQAIRDEDGYEIHKAAVNVTWDSTNLARIGLDMAQQSA